ncbi:hypothetical protein SAMN03159496_01748 [Rhizobium sp. NFR07]|uniref:hypothetical protein n=1 Tax=Rhizobium sp. NFR07 TaxID=1566262 RepID=UPI0008EE39A4|nr:hypothetical protein [Rhizobium sp. NFR07]SFB08350.1 hypothetical protein SAMN03159496_01748 [Rhizobium sp. NFR07]
MNETPPVSMRAEDQVSEILRRNEKAMMDAILKVCEDTERRTADDLKSAGVDPIRMRDGYSASVALHLLFLQQCGADMETSKGGDAKRASQILRAGRRISAHYWEGIDAEQSAGRSDIAMDREEQRELAVSAQRAASRAVMRALVEQASTADPDLRDRITADIETYIARLAPISETDRYFAERVRENAALLLQPPSVQTPPVKDTSVDDGE